MNQRLTGGDFKAARIAKYAVETALKELEYKQKAGELISIDIVSKEWFALTRMSRDNLNNLAPRLSGLLAAERNQDRCFALIQKEVDQVWRS